MKVPAVAFGSLLMFFFAVSTLPENALPVSLDASWMLGLVANLQQGKICGRDFIFTYGPLAQALTHLSLYFYKGNLLVNSLPLIFLIWDCTLILLLGCSLMLIRDLSVKHIAFLYVTLTLLNIVNSNPLPYCRALCTVFCAVLLYRAMTARGQKRRLVLAAVTGLCGFLAQLISVDLGLYAIVGSTLVLGLYSVFTLFPGLLKRDDLGQPNDYAQMLLMLLGTFVLANIALSAFFKLSSPDYAHFFDYQKNSLAVMRGYADTMGQRWPLPRLQTLSLFLILLYSMIVIVTNLRRYRPQDLCLLLCLLIFSCVAIKGGAVRSDEWHILLAVIPSLFLFLLLAKNWTPGRTNDAARLAWIILCIFLFLKWHWAGGYWHVHLFLACLPLLFLVYLLGERWTATAGPQIRLVKTGVYVLMAGLWAWAGFFPVGDLRGFSPSHIKGDLSHLKRISAIQMPLETLLPQGLAHLPGNPSTPMLSFPYDNYIPIALGRPLVTPALQAYSAHTQALQRYYVAALERQPANLQVLYGLDDIVVCKIDGVPEETRLPIIFEYLHRNFALASAHAYGGGYFLLERRPQPVDFQVSQMAYSSSPTPDALATCRLSTPARSSLVRVTLKVDYPPARSLGRPERVMLVFLSRGVPVHQSLAVAIEVGKPFFTDISLSDSSQFYRVFSRAGLPSRPWDSLKILPEPTGFSQVAPRAVKVVGIESLNAAG